MKEKVKIDDEEKLETSELPGMNDNDENLTLDLSKIIVILVQLHDQGRFPFSPNFQFEILELFPVKLRSFLRNKTEHKIFVKLSQVVIYHEIF